VQQLLEHHDAAPAVYPQIGWQQVNAGLDEVEAVPFSCIDLSELPAAEQETALKLLLLSSGKLEPGGGSTVAGGSVGSGDNQPNRLLLVIHHRWMASLGEF